MNSGSDEGHGGAKRGLLALLHVSRTSTNPCRLTEPVSPEEGALAAFCFLRQASCERCPF
jgi:hypothetical protein